MLGKRGIPITEATRRLRIMVDDELRLGDDDFRRMLGLTPSVPKDEVELALLMDEQPRTGASGNRPAGARTAPDSPRNRR